MVTDLDVALDPVRRRRPTGRRSRLPAVGALAAALAISLAMLAPTTRAETATVTIADSEYRPATVTIQVGDSVTWVQDSKLLHTVTADGGAFTSHDLGDLDTYGFVFETPGTYAYHCKIHPMTGKVIVLRAGASPSASSVSSAAASSPSSPAPSVGPSDGSAAPSIVSPPADAGNGVSPLAIAGIIGVVLAVVVLLLFVIPARRTPKGDDRG